MAQFQLGWFLAKAFSIQGWNEPGYGTGYDYTKPDLYQDAIRALERACFDLLIIEDSSTVPDNYGSSMDFYLKTATMVPKFDPVVLVPYLASVTKHIGIAPTMTSTFYPPFLLARLLATLDHTTGGRVGWNIVTATNDGAARNYGYDRHIEHDLRYDMADEFISLVTQLWESWEPDAVVMDTVTKTFADPSKVHRVNFDGKFYKSRGPLNLPHSPQGRPVFVIPGGSPRGRKFGARHAEVVLAGGASIAEMKAYRDEVHALMPQFGRRPSETKFLFTVTPIVVKDHAEAEEYHRQNAQMSAERLEVSLAAMSYLSGIDFSEFDLDSPLPEITTNGMQTILSRFAAHGPGATLREIASRAHSYPLVGTADAVAGEMDEMMQEIGGDGFLITGLFKPSYIVSIVDQLVPALRRRGCLRTGYEHALFRDNLFGF